MNKKIIALTLCGAMVMAGPTAAFAAERNQEFGDGSTSVTHVIDVMAAATQKSESAKNSTIDAPKNTENVSGTTPETTPAAVTSAEKDWVGQPYEIAVTELMKAGIITGDVDGLFHPNDNLTRAQACKIVISTINPSEAELTGTATQMPGVSRLIDLAGYKWAEPYIKYAASNGIVKGYPDGTFKPGENVTVAEMAAMLIRAAKVDESTITGEWPKNYVNKAAELGFYKDTGLVDQYGEYASSVKATKWMAAWLTYNAKPAIDAANAQSKVQPPQGTDKDVAEGVPSIGDMKFVKGSFDSNMTAFDGKKLSADLVLYTYGVTSDYKSDMTMSDSKSDYRKDTVYKFKNVSTPAWYKLIGGEITEIIVPMDAGFSGIAYSVVNGVVDVLNYNNTGVKGLETLTATRPVMWVADAAISEDSGMIKATDIADAIKNGDIYEIRLNDGEITEIPRKVTTSGTSGAFRELTTSHAWTKIENTNLDKNLVTLEDSKTYELRENASVYMVNSDGKYEAGRRNDIKRGRFVRLYDISDDDQDLADIIVISESK